MSVTNVPAKAEAETDRLGKKILDSIVAAKNNLAEKSSLVEQVRLLEHANRQLESEVACLKLALSCALRVQGTNCAPPSQERARPIA